MKIITQNMSGSSKILPRPSSQLTTAGGTPVVVVSGGSGVTSSSVTVSRGSTLGKNLLYYLTLSPLQTALVQSKTKNRRVLWSYSVQLCNECLNRSVKLVFLTPNCKFVCLLLYYFYICQYVMNNILPCTGWLIS